MLYLPGNLALIRPNEGVMVVNSPLIRPYFLGGGGIGRVSLNSHEYTYQLKRHETIGHSFMHFSKLSSTFDVDSTGQSGCRLGGEETHEVRT